jgi:hypothetical protein
MEHSVLGTRWAYDGIDDDCFLMVLCGLTATRPIPPVRGRTLHSGLAIEDACITGEIGWRT